MTLHLSEIPLDPSRWQWRWEDMCGPKGLQPWSPIEHDLGLCFQQLCLHIPVLFLFSIVSAYFFGRQIEFVRRGSKQILAINARIFISVMLALLPIVEIYVYLSMTNIKISPINYFLSMTEFLTWFIHLGFLIALKNRFGISCRGPISICILWSIIFVITIISFRSHVIIYRNEESSFHVDISMVCIFSELIFQLFYAITLIPGDSDAELISYPTFFYAPAEEIDERSPLLGRSNGYAPFFEENGPEYLGSAMESTSFLSRLLFYWVNPLMYKGLQRKIINADSLFDLPPDLESITLAQKLDKALIGNVDRVRQRSRVLSVPVEYDSIAPSDLPSDDNNGNKGHVKRHNVSLLKALHVCFALQFYGIGVLRLLADCAGFTGPLLLNRLVSFIENKSEDIKWGYYYAFALCGTTLIAAIANAHFNFRMGLVGLKIRGALITTIYKKTLTACPKVLNEKFNVGEVVNFMSTDTDRIVNSCPSFHAFWSIPFQLAVSLYLLYSQVGLVFLAGVAFSIILLPINKLIANKIGKLSTLMMKQKDERVKLMTEIIRGIRTVKYHAWETHFIGLISKCRDEELKYLKARKYLDALCVFFWAITPVLISILTFATYVLLGNKLTAATVFTTMALLNMLIAPLNAFPWVLNGVTEAWVSIKRIQALLDIPDLDFDTYYDQYLLDSQSNACIIIKNGKFSWGKNSNWEKKMERKTSTVSIKSMNIQDDDEVENENFLPEGGKEEKNTKVVRFIDQEDFYLSSINLVVKKGEFIGIMGDVGSGKSSLLSGILAELEREGGNIAVADNEYGFGFVTQEPWLQRGTIRDNILFGKAYDESRYQSVLRACCLHEDLYMLPGGDETGVGDGGNTLSGGQKARVALARAIYQDKPIYIMDDILSAVDVNVAKHIFQHCIMGLLKNKTKILCTHHTQYLLYADYVVVMHKGMIFQQGKPGEVLSDLEEIILTTINELEESTSGQDHLLHRSVSFAKDVQLDNDSVLEEETKETGTVEFKVYATYWTAIGHLLSISILLAITMMQSSKNITDLWLSFWVSNESNKTEFQILIGAPENDLNVKYYLLVYVVLAAASTIFTLLRAFLFAYGGITAAARIHKQLLKTIMKAKVTFFDISPLGRILNRFSSDTYTIDDSLPFILNILLAQLFGVLGAITVTIYGLPWLCLVLAPLFPIYHWLQNHYRLTSRELKRLSSLTLSPVYSHFSETLQGLSTIRAFRATQRFKFDNEERVENSQKTQFASHAAGQWLALRLQFIGVAMVTGVGIIAVVQHQFDVADSGLVGLAISYALSITGLLSGVVNAFTETEREMIAVERVSQYIEEVEPEKISNEEMEAVNPPYAWPSQGVIAFNNVVLKYRNHLAPSLKGVSFETRPAEKIGVVGRTGAGKSSLLTALFRLVEIYSGSIYIDTVNIASLDLTALRSRLSIIPQKPFLYSGTVAENLDPLQEFRATELWSALKRCKLDGVVRRMGGLEATLISAGQNLSVGQRQLLCLARALLHKTKILCIDEATANVDFQTDRIIQQTIQSSFRQSTVITIAHRVQTIMDCDRVLVMGDGQILEFDTPKNLMQEPDSYFFQLANKEM